MTLPPDDGAPLTAAQPPGIRQYQERSLFVLLLGIALSSPLVTGSVFAREGLTPLSLVAMALTAAVWLLLGLYHYGQRQRVANLLVYVLVLASGAAIAAQGSVRSSASLVMLAAVVGAGTFLPRRSMLLCAALAIALLGTLNLMENRGLLPVTNMDTGWAVWVTQAAVLLSLLVAVSFGRRRMIHAFQAQNRALEEVIRTQDELKASQARLQALFRNNPAACAVQVLASRTLVEANEAFIQMFGYPRSELLHQTPPTLWHHPPDRQAFRAALHASGRVRGMQAQGRRKDGTLFDAKVHAEVVRPGDEDLVMVMVIDVTAEVASRRELEQSRDRFSKAFNFSPLGMTITRLSDGQFVEVNPANERVLGWTQADFAGRNALEAGVWPSREDRDRYVAQLLHDGRLAGYETRMRTKAGEVVDVKVWAEKIELDGEPCILSFTLNVAEEKRREAILLNVAQGVSEEVGEAFFRSLVEHLARAIGADGVMVGEVGEHRRLRTLATIWQGQLLPPQEHPLHFTLCEQTLQQHRLLQHEIPEPGPMPLVAPFRHASLRAFAGMPLRDDDGAPVGLLMAVWRDRPPRQHDLPSLLTIFGSRCTAELQRLRRDREIASLHGTLEQRVAERTAQLHYLNRELDAFAYTVSHDLKSPLRAIDGFMHLLQEQLDDRLQPDDRDLMQRVQDSVARMGSLITDLLSLARVSQGQLQRMDTDLTDLAESVIRRERDRDPTREVRICIAPGLRANCDPRMAQIVLENLLGNAWKYSRQQPDAMIELGLLAATPDAADTAVPQFYIRDNGAGFDMSRADRLFKPFTRLHSPQEFEGTGIGLATVRRIIERHGGEIQAQGAVGAGATFRFSFGRPGIDG